MNGDEHIPMAPVRTGPPNNEGAAHDRPQRPAGAGRQHLLRAVAEAMSADLDLRQVVQRVAELVTGAVGSDVCFVHLVDEDRRCIVLTGATPPFDELAGTVELGLGEGVAGWVALHGQPALVPDKWSDPRYRYIPSLRGEDFSSLVSVPMVRRGTRVVGVLNVHARRPGAFTPADVELLSDVANLLAGTVENALLYRRLAEREETLSRFAVRTIEAHEAERRRLAGDLHDGISQRLLSVWYHLDAAASANPGEPDQVDRELARARELTEAALSEARTAIVGLRPGVLDDLGLGAALESLARSVPGIDVEVDVDTCQLAAHVETALYRIAQEALQNVVKHSRADGAWLSLHLSRGNVVLTVADNGQGLPADPAPTGTTFGLVGMRERADMLGAGLAVRSRPGEGTTVEVTVPTHAISTPDRPPQPSPG